MSYFDHLVPEAHRITQESGLEKKERVGIINPETKRPLPGRNGSYVRSFSGETVTIAFTSGDEMESLDIQRNLLYSLSVVTALYDGWSPDEIIASRKKRIAEAA